LTNKQVRPIIVAKCDDQDMVASNVLPKRAAIWCKAVQSWCDYYLQAAPERGGRTAALTLYKESVYNTGS
jgi:hypothetical protein